MNAAEEIKKLSRPALVRFIADLIKADHTMFPDAYALLKEEEETAIRQFIERHDRRKQQIDALTAQQTKDEEEYKKLVEAMSVMNNTVKDLRQQVGDKVANVCQMPFGAVLTPVAPTDTKTGATNTNINITMSDSMRQHVIDMVNGHGRTSAEPSFKIPAAIRVTPNFSKEEKTTSTLQQSLVMDTPPPDLNTNSDIKSLDKEGSTSSWQSGVSFRIVANNKPKGDRRHVVLRIDANVAYLPLYEHPVFDTDKYLYCCTKCSLDNEVYEHTDVSRHWSKSTKWLYFLCEDHFNADSVYYPGIENEDKK